jgi:hypothetical protein
MGSEGQYASQLQSSCEGLAFDFFCTRRAMQITGLFRMTIDRLAVSGQLPRH